MLTLLAVCLSITHSNTLCQRNNILSTNMLQRYTLQKCMLMTTHTSTTLVPTALYKQMDNSHILKSLNKNQVILYTRYCVLLVYLLILVSCTSNPTTNSHARAIREPHPPTSSARFNDSLFRYQRIHGQS